MFSGLTNQVSSWIGSAMGEKEEQVPTPTEYGTAVLNPENKQDSSPSKLDVVANVKNQIGEGDGPRDGEKPRLAKEKSETPGSEKSMKESPVEQKDDDDNSSATDSNSGFASGNPTEEKDGQFEAVSNKVLSEAKLLGNFLYSAVNKAGKTISEAGAMIKKTVEENSILAEFNKEQDAFLQSKVHNSSDSDAAVPPWVGYANEEFLREECLSLSTDKRNFVRSPPTGVDFHFDYDVSYPIAIATMKVDPNLKNKRFELVPKVITEENFWRNYFYRVSLICQANTFSYVDQEDDQTATDDDLSGFELDFE